MKIVPEIKETRDDGTPYRVGKVTFSAEGYHDETVLGALADILSRSREFHFTADTVLIKGEPKASAGLAARGSSSALQCWFELSYASWLTLPRVLMEAMPVEWQDRMAALLNEYREAFPNQPDIGTRVQVTRDGKLIPTPDWLINYRRPNRAEIDELRARPTES